MTAAPARKSPPYRIEKDRNVPPCPPDRYVEVGMVVQHYPDAAKNAQATCAMVTKVGLETIDCNIVHPALGTMMPFSGVHHMDYQAERVDTEGAWRPLAVNVAMLKFMIAMGALAWDGDSKYLPTAAQEAIKDEKANGSSPPPPPIA